MMREAGILPGRFKDMFKGFFNPKVKQLLTEKELKNIDRLSLKNCSEEDSDCNRFLLNARTFIVMMEFLFPRPFPRLGSLISLFEYKIFPNEKYKFRF
jgi:hypothetical protein